MLLASVISSVSNLSANPLFLVPAVNGAAKSFELYLGCLPEYPQLVGQIKNARDAKEFGPDCGTLFGLLERRRQSTLLSPHRSFQSKAESL